MPIIIIDKVNEDAAGRTGSGFLNNSLDFIKTTYTLELDTTFNPSAFTQVVKNGNTFTLTNSDWASLIAAFNGAGCDFWLKQKNTPSSPTPTSTTVNYVNGAVMELADDGNYPDGAYQIGFFQITDDIEEFSFDINLVTNTIGNGTASLIDGEAVRFSSVLVNALTPLSGTDDFVQLGNKSGGSQFPVKTISRLADASNGNAQYELIVEYKNWLCINDTPFASSEAVGDYWLFTALMVSGDPSTTVSGDFFQQGNTGYQDENFNGFPSDYILDSIVWEDDSANVMEAFDYTQNSNFTITILGNFNAGDDFNLKMFTLPNDESEYQNLPNPIENNLMLAINPTLISGGVPTNVTGNLNDSGAGFDIQNLTFTITAGVDVVVTGKVVPNADFTTLFEGRDVADRKYTIWVQCEDSTLPYKGANRVNVLANFEDAKENVLPLGKWTAVSTFELEDHNQDVYIGDTDPYTEDDTLTNLEFTLPKDSVSNPWEAIKGRIVAENFVTSERFTIEEFVYNIGDLIPLPDETLLIDYTQNRGFKLPVTSDKHNVTIQRLPGLDTGSDFGVQLRYPFINRYEYWLTLPQASNDFAGSKNQFWFQYADAANWTVRWEYGIETKSGGEYTDGTILNIHDYDDWGEAIGSSISFEKLDSTPITKPFSDQITKVICTHELDTEDWNGNEWALIHVRPEEGAPQWLIGSVLDSSDNNNPLQPLSGETKGKLTVGTKVLTIEALFDPSKIDTSGNITFSTRVNGDTTGGLRANIYEETFELAKNPIIPTLRGFVLQEEDRGYKGCCEPQLVLADISDPARSKNDVAAPRAFGDSVSFNLTKNGVPTAYSPVSVQFPNQPDAWYASVEWRDVLTIDGPGCYSIDIVPTVAGNVQPSFKWGTFVLKPYSVVDGSSGNIYYHAKYKARILSQFNDVNDKDGINYTDSFLLESVRFNGKFGYFQPNTEIDNLEQTDGRMQKVRREDFFTYELRSALLTKCIVPTILTHLRGENSCWLSSYNYDDFDYFDLTDKPVIVNEGATIEHIDGSRQIKLVAKFEDKIKSCRTHFQDNRQTSETQAPPPAPSVTLIQGGAKLMKSNQTISYRGGDDGDKERGRLNSFFELENNSPWGHPYRWCGTNGGYTDGTSYFDVNGSPSTKGAEFSDNIVLDMSTLHTDSTILAYYIGEISGLARDWNGSIDWGEALVTGGYSDWGLMNAPEGFNIINYGSNSLALDYPPFDVNTSIGWWTSTTLPNLTTTAPDLNNSRFSIERGTKTFPLNNIATRNFTLAELGL